MKHEHPLTRNSMSHESKAISQGLLNPCCGVMELNPERTGVQKNKKKNLTNKPRVSLFLNSPQRYKNSRQLILQTYLSFQGLIPKRKQSQ